MHELTSNYRTKLAGMIRRVSTAKDLRELQKLDTELRQLIDAISDDIVAVSEAPVTMATTPKAPRSGKKWLDALYEPVVETYVAPEVYDHGVSGKVTVTYVKEVLGQEFYDKRQYKDPQRRNPKMNRSLKGVAVKVLMQELERVKDEVYDVLFDVSDTIERIKRNPSR